MRRIALKRWLLAGIVAAGAWIVWRTAAARYIHEEERRQGKIRPVRHFWTDVGEWRIHARMALPPQPPDAPPVVLVHGFGMSSAYFVPTAERLATCFTVYAPDLPGHGKSDTPREALDVSQFADALIAWMNAVGIERASLVGHSFGCQIAVDAAVHYPERVERVILVGPTTDPAGRGLASILARLLCGGAHEHPSLNLVLVKDYGRMGARLLSELRYMRLDPIEDKLPYVDAPTLLVRGEKDPIVSQRWLEAAAQLLGTRRLAVVPGRGHALNYSAAAELVEIIQPFLQETSDVRVTAISAAQPAAAHNPAGG